MAVFSRLRSDAIMISRNLVSNAGIDQFALVVSSKYAKLGWVSKTALFFAAQEILKMLLGQVMVKNRNANVFKSIMLTMLFITKKAAMPIAWVMDSTATSIAGMFSWVSRPSLVLGPELICSLEGEPGKIVRHKGQWWLIEGDGYYTRVTLSGGKFNRAIGEENGYINDQDVLMTHETVSHFLAPNSPGECALAGVTSQGIPSAMAKGSCLVFVKNDRGELVHWSSCTVLEDCLCLCRHGLDSREEKKIYLQSKYAQNGKKKFVEIPFERLKFLDDKIKEHTETSWSDDEFCCSAFDFAAGVLLPDELSMLGISSWKIDKNIQRSYAGKACKLTYALDEFNVHTFTGNVPQKDAFAHELGIGLARVHSVTGASSSPLTVVDEQLKLGGMWLGKPTRSLEHHQGKYNAFMTVDCMVGNLRTLGLFKCPLAEKIKNICDNYGAQLMNLKFPGETSDVSQSDDGRDPDEYFGATKKERRDMRNAQKDSQSREDQRKIEREEQDKINQNLHGESKIEDQKIEKVDPVRAEVEELKQLVAVLINKVQPTPPGLSSPEEEEVVVQKIPEEEKKIVPEVFSKGKECGHAKSATVSTGNIGPVMSENKKAAMARLAMEIAADNEATYIQAKCLLWKNAMLTGEADEALQDIQDWVKSTVDDGVNGDGAKACKQRIHLLMNAPCNVLMKEYIKKTEPIWGDNVQDGVIVEGRNTIIDIDGDPYFEFVGTTAQGFSKKPKTRTADSDLQADFRRLAELYHADGSHGCTKGRYQVPLTTKANIEASMRAQAAMTSANRPWIFVNKSTFVEEPWLITQKKMKWVDAVDRATKKYKDAMAKQGHATILTHLEEGQLGLYKVFLGLQQTSSGATSRFLSDTKKNWVKEHAEEATDLAITRIILIAACGNDIQYLSEVEMVELGLKDCLDSFIKGELHSPNKMLQRRYRLIWISSLIDIIVQSLLHKADNAYFTEAYQKGFMNSAATGLGHDDRGVERMVQAFMAENLENHNVSCDATAFDLSIDYEFIRADAERRADVVQGSAVADLIVNYSFVLSRHILNNNGDVWAVKKFGVTTSGMISTTSQNTFARSCQAAYAGCTNWVCSGDDLVADFKFDSDILAADLQIATRDETDNFGTTDFTSHNIDFMRRTAAHTNTEKLLWTLHHKVSDVCNNPNRLGAVLHVLRNTPGVKDDVQEIVDRHGINVVGKIFNNEDALRDFD